MYYAPVRDIWEGTCKSKMRGLVKIKKSPPKECTSLTNDVKDFLPDQRQHSSSEFTETYELSLSAAIIFAPV